jgi:hypothetical protein
MTIYHLAAIGILGVCMLAFALCVFLYNHMANDEVRENPLDLASQARSDMEKIGWLTGMLLKQEIGKLKIGQIELLDEIRKFADHGAKQLATLVKREQTAHNVSHLLFTPKHPAKKNSEA